MITSLGGGSGNSPYACLKNTFLRQENCSPGGQGSGYDMIISGDISFPLREIGAGRRPSLSRRILPRGDVAVESAVMCLVFLRPARGDHFRFRIKAHAIFAQGMCVAVEGPLPPGEREQRDRRRHAQIHAHHAGLHRRGDLACDRP